MVSGIFFFCLNVEGFKQNAATTDLTELIPEELESSIKEAAQTSMGPDINEGDIMNVSELCQQVIDISEYRFEK